MEIIAYDKAQLNNTAVALGKFEGIHKGHMLLINKITKLSQNAKSGESRNDENIKSVVFTINMNEKKAINLDFERYDIFSSCGVDYVCECPFDEKISRLSPEAFIKNILVERLGAAYVVVGTDFRFGYKRSGGVDTLKRYAKQYNYEVIVFEKLRVGGEVISSSAIRKLLDEGNMKKVTEYMGRPYFISGEVTFGKQLGRTIGFPTANLIPDLKKKLPFSGAYETRVYIENDSLCYKAITNVGSNPTVNEEKDLNNSSEFVIETHLLDYSGNLYGKNIKVEFLDFLRPEEKFDSFYSLKKQLETDKERVKKHI